MSVVHKTSMIHVALLNASTLSENKANLQTAALETLNWSVSYQGQVKFVLSSQ